MVVVTHEIGFAKEIANASSLWMKEKYRRDTTRNLCIEKPRTKDFLESAVIKIFKSVANKFLSKQAQV